MCMSLDTITILDLIKAEDGSKPKILFDAMDYVYLRSEKFVN